VEACVGLWDELADGLLGRKIPALFGVGDEAAEDGELWGGQGRLMGVSKVLLTSIFMVP
jgi:hypothetical protein